MLHKLDNIQLGLETDLENFEEEIKLLEIQLSEAFRNEEFLTFRVIQTQVKE